MISEILSKVTEKLKSYDLSTTINNFLHIVESSIKKGNLNIILNLNDTIKNKWLSKWINTMFNQYFLIMQKMP